MSSEISRKRADKILCCWWCSTEFITHQKLKSLEQFGFSKYFAHNQIKWRFSDYGFSFRLLPLEPAIFKVKKQYKCSGRIKTSQDYAQI